MSLLLPTAPLFACTQPHISFVNEFLEEMEALVQGDESLSELGEGEEEHTVRL
uniref:Uncharacterized protein n=1 Tax=Lotus japonicus TaxID=34305 RepID=I3S1I2_LOTJA|nr:unknown [Lotus japonicus]